MDRIEAVGSPHPAAHADGVSPARTEFDDELEQFESLRPDLLFVEMYKVEMEKRCREGISWEGWLIVEDLKSQGIVGSVPSVYGRDDDGV